MFHYLGSSLQQKPIIVRPKKRKVCSRHIWQQSEVLCFVCFVLFCFCFVFLFVCFFFLSFPTNEKQLFCDFLNSQSSMLTYYLICSKQNNKIHQLPSSNENSFEYNDKVSVFEHLCSAQFFSTIEPSFLEILTLTIIAHRGSRNSAR